MQILVVHLESLRCSNTQCLTKIDGSSPIRQSLEKQAINMPISRDGQRLRFFSAALSMDLFEMREVMLGGVGGANRATHGADGIAQFTTVHPVRCHDLHEPDMLTEA